jgi:hypothetical protein
MNIRTPFPALVLSIALTLSAVALTGCGMLAYTARHGFSTPPAAEFGLGPRTSAVGGYVATIEADEPLRTGAMQSVRLRLHDAAGAPVRGATIAVDGGMPQHGHGLPTHPRVTGESAAGVYQVDGLRFNMGGWWELRFTFERAGLVDRVTFNVRL